MNSRRITLVRSLSKGTATNVIREDLASLSRPTYNQVQEGTSTVLIIHSALVTLDVQRLVKWLLVRALFRRFSHSSSSWSGRMGRFMLCFLSRSHSWLSPFPSDSERNFQCVWFGLASDRNDHSQVTHRCQSQIWPTTLGFPFDQREKHGTTRSCPTITIRYRFVFHRFSSREISRRHPLDYRATLTIQTWIGWSDFFTYAIKGRDQHRWSSVMLHRFASGYTKAVLKLLSTDELVRQYMLQVALYIAAHYGNVDLVKFLFSSFIGNRHFARLELCCSSVHERIVPSVIIRRANGARLIAPVRNFSVVPSTKRSSRNKLASSCCLVVEMCPSFKSPMVTE